MEIELRKVERLWCFNCGHLTVSVGGSPWKTHPDRCDDSLTEVYPSAERYRFTVRRSE